MKIYKENNRKIISYRNIFAFILSLLPLMTSIKSPFGKLSMSYVMLAFFLPVIIINMRFLRTNKRIWLTILFWLYFVIRSGGDYLNCTLIAGICYIYLLAVSNGQLNFESYKNYILNISTIAAILVILQTLFHYIFGIHIPMMSTNIIFDHLKGYEVLFKTGFSVVDSMYRPSAFFFEPAQFCQYCFVGLLVALESWRYDSKYRINVILISIGMIVTTSGQGLVLLLGCIIWGVVMKREQKLIRLMVRAFIIVCVLLAIIFLAYSFNIFNSQSIINRVIDTNNGYNAIAGRTFAKDWYLINMTQKEKILGVGYINRPDVYMTTSILLRYTLGYLGLLLFICMIIIPTKKSLSSISFIVSIAYIGLIFIANLFNISSIIFYLSFVYAERKCEDFRYARLSKMG